MDELTELRQKLKKRRSQLEDAVLAFDLEAAEWLEEVIHQLECDIKILEEERK